MSTNQRKTSERANEGYTLIELIIVLVVVGLVASLAVPNVREEVNRMRVRGALNRVVGQIHRARVTAVESGAPTRVVLRSADGGCVERIRIVTVPGGEERSIDTDVLLPGLCMRHTGDSILNFDSRGMLKPPARSIRVNYGSTADSVVLSIAGRIRRTFRRSSTSKAGHRRRAGGNRFSTAGTILKRLFERATIPARWSPRLFAKTR